MVQHATQSSMLSDLTHSLHALTWHHQKRTEQLLARGDLNLTAPQMVTLMAIARLDVCRMSDLAHETLQSPGTLTGIVDRLIDSGLVTRVRNMNDRRVVNVTLTEQGHAHLATLDDARYKDTSEALAHLSSDELNHALEVVDVLLNAMSIEQRRSLREQEIAG